MKNDVLKRKKSGRKKYQIDHKTKKKRTVELIISEECGDSPKQVQRYIINAADTEFLQKLMMN